MFGTTIQVLANAPANGHINALVEGQSAEYSLVVSNTHRMMNKKNTGYPLEKGRR